MNPWIPHLLRAGGGGGGPVLPPAGRTMLANLTSSLILDEGTGGPTWSRATKAWGFNELGYLEELASGCAFFGGARLVRNTSATKSEDFSNAAWTKGNVTVTGTNTIVCTNATNLQRVYRSGTSDTLTTGSKFCYAYRIQRVVGGVDFVQITGNTAGFGSVAYCNFSLVDGTFNAVGCTAAVTVVGADTYDICATFTATATGVNLEYSSLCLVDSLAAARIASFTGDGIKSFELLRAWSVDVTNYDASYVPEYVSVGVVSSPYHGAGIDGAKYFNTGWNGAPLTCLGFRREAAATNNLLYGRDLTMQSVSMTSKRWEVTGTYGAELVTNGTFTADLSNWTPAVGAGGSITATGGLCTFVSDGSAYTGITNSALLTIGKTYVGTVVISSGTGSIKFQSVLEVTGLVPGTNTFNFVANGTPIIFARTVGIACNLVIDSISIKEAAVQCTRVTGLDGIANTATTLTAGAADAIILQPITLASAERCASAYVKRRTGTGTISFTQDGGSTWTDITSLINSSTWSRVQITSTLANPSTGFKISTSGDAIDVDCVQNEAGTVATSPIVTTTATVTRNADSLTYQTASNIDFAVGTLYCEAQFTAAISTRRAVAIGADGWSYINTGDANTIWKAYDGTNIVTKSGLSDISTAKRKRVVSWGTGLKVTGDGLSPASGSFDGSLGSGASIEIGQFINGYIGPVAIYNYQMTDAELQAITT